MSEHQFALQKILSLLQADELASLGPETRANREPLQILENKLRRAFSETKFSESSQTLIRSLVLLWHDYLDESHSISQEIHSSDGSFLHGIMHRREPDYGNAKYWFHRVGGHSSYPILAVKAGEILNGTKLHDLKSKLIRENTWDPFAFVDACEVALRKNDDSTISVLKQIQEIEFKTLLQHFTSPPTK